MHSSWFQKPIYKKVNLFTIICIAVSVAVLYFSSIGWYFLAFIAFLYIAFSILSSSSISSGVYISAICKVPVKEKLLCLTFDDGPDKKTLELLQMMEDFNAKATFFLTGNKVINNLNGLLPFYKLFHKITSNKPRPPGY